MNLKEKILKITSDVHSLDKTNTDVQLPQHAYYLNDHEVVCFEREKGESRFPYDADGLVVWAKSSGYLEAVESTFQIFKTILRNEEPNIGFFVGVPMENKEYFPISVLGVGRQMYEPFPVTRYVVYSLRAAYYVAETDTFIAAVRVHTDSQKKIHFSFVVINQTEEPIRLYASSYFEPWLSFEPYENFFARMHRFGQFSDGTYFISNTDNFLVCNTDVEGKDVICQHHTCGRNTFLGPSGRQIMNAVSLKDGSIKESSVKVNTTDIPVIADMYHFNLVGGDSLRMIYEMSYCHNRDKAERMQGCPVDSIGIDEDLMQQEMNEITALSNLEIYFEDWHHNVNAHVLNRFLKHVQKQISLCALGKNYAGPMLGVRDVMQQLESCLLWQPEKARTQLVTALNYILEDGRPPRQFSLPAREEDIPKMDLREFIDQGNWIISMMYTYLAYTNDFAILEEICGYYKVIDNDKHMVVKSTMRDSVLMHLVRIMDFLSANLDSGHTDCLKALYGDWNDALDGLGKTNEEAQRYGTGVSVMASLHFYQNCKEIVEILSKIGGFEKKIHEYEEYRERIEIGLMKYAVQTNEQGEKRIIHGWGDKNSYQIGSFCDPDGKARISSTANSFFALSGMIQKYPEMKSIIVSAFEKLSSKYGFLTFDEPMPLSMEKYAGRIVKITKGTYENAASYVHSSTFAIMALFALGESEWAFQELEKSIVISHENCTMTPFVMPNSYCYNEEFGMDGESMGDWYTGSGTVLIKGLVKYGFGLCPDLEGLTIQTARNLPCTECTIKTYVKGQPITLKYVKRTNDERQIYVNGVRKKLSHDTLMHTFKVFIPNEDITGPLFVEVVD